MSSYGSLIPKIREQPFDASKMLYHHRNEQDCPLDYSVKLSGANNSHCEGSEEQKSIIVVVDSDISDHETGKSHQPLENPGENCNQSFGELRANTYSSLYSIPHNASHLNGLTSHPRAYSNNDTREQQVAYSEQAPKSYDYNLAETPNETVVKTGSAHSPSKHQLHENTPHMNSHSEQSPSAYEAGDYTSSGLANSNRYRITHTGGKLDNVQWGCAVCNFKSSNRSTLAIHLKTHLQEMPFSCRTCDYYFANAFALDGHLKVHHYDGNNEQKSTVSQSSTENRIDWNGDKPSSSSHHSRNHPGADCNPTVRFPDYTLDRKPDVEMSPKPDSDGYRIFTHDITKRAPLKSSGRTDDALLPSTQDEGTSRYNRENTSSHCNSEEKSFSCPICVFRTNDKWKLVTHVNLHSRDMPLQSQVCKSYYANAFDLESHIHGGSNEQNSAVQYPTKMTNNLDNRDSSSSDPRDLQRIPGAKCGQTPEGCDYPLAGTHNEKLLETASGHLPFTHNNTPTYASIKSSIKANNAFSTYSTLTQNGANSSDNRDSIASNSHHLQKRPGSDYEPGDCDYTLTGTPNEKLAETGTGYKPFMHNNNVHAPMKSSERTNDAFSTNLKERQNTNTEVKSFSSELCVLKTHTKQNLKNHADSHFGQTPCQCEVCKYNFANTRDIGSQHLRSHHYDGNQERESAAPNLSIDEAKSNDNTSNHHPQKQVSAKCWMPPAKPVVPSSVVKEHDNTAVGSSAMKIYLKTDSGYMPIMHETKRECDAYSVTDRTLLKKHHETEETPNMEKPFFYCPICFVNIGWEDNLNTHISMHYKRTQFSCRVCNYYFMDTWTLQAHWKSQHERQILPNSSLNNQPNSQDQGDYPSNSYHPYMHPRAAGCDYTLTGASSQAGFPKTEAENRPIIHDSKSTYTSQAKFLRRTNAEMETSPSDFSDYTSPNDVTNHTTYPHYFNRLEMNHPEEKVFSCIACDFRTNDKWNLEHHQRTHLLMTSYFCKVCCYYFSSKSDLESHMRVHHCEADDREISLPTPSIPIEKESNSSAHCISSSSLNPQVSTGADEGAHEECDYRQAETSDVNLLSEGDTEVRPLMHNIPEATPDSTNTHTEEQQLLHEENGHTNDHTSVSKSQLESFTEELSSEKDGSDLKTPHHAEVADPSNLQAHANGHTKEKRCSTLEACDYTFGDTEVRPLMHNIHVATPDSTNTHTEERKLLHEENDHTHDHTSASESHLRSFTEKLYSSERDGSDLKTPHHTGEADPSNLQAHAKGHTEEKLYSTPEACDYTFGNNSPLASHTMTYDEPKTFLCEFCFHTFVDASDFESHMKNHSDGEPGSAQDESGNLQSSVEGQTAKKRYACQVCDYKSNHHFDLKVHGRIHTGEKPHKCTICEYSSNFRSGLSQHMISHSGQKPFACGVCNFKTAYQGALRKHETSHTREKLSCSECGYKCDRKTTLRAHLKTHRKEEPVTPTCYVCGHKSNDLSTLRDHMETHTNGNPLSGNACDSKSTNMENLVKVTTKETFTCEICEYTSTSAVKLERHKKRKKHNIVGRDKFAKKRRIMYSGCRY